MPLSHEGVFGAEALIAMGVGLMDLVIEGTDFNRGLPFRGTGR